MRTRRIAMISEHASPLAALGGADSGGQNVYVAQLAAHLARLGFAVDVFTRRDCCELPEIVASVPGVRVVHVPAGPPEPVPKEHIWPHMEEFLAFTCRFVHRGSYDLVHANFWMSGWAGLALKREFGLPLVVTFHALGRVRRLHQGESDGFPDIRIDIEDELVREADRIIAECPQDRTDLVDMYGADESRIAIVPCGFDPAEFAPMDRTRARKQLGFPDDEPIVLQLGRIVPRKGIETPIQALAALRQQFGLTPRLLVVGGESNEPDPAQTPEIGRLQGIAEDCGVSSQVTFAGSRPRTSLRAYYSAADVFVTTPWYEPFGITPLEAMACAVPVVGSAVGGLQSTIVHGETGYLVPPRNSAMLAERLACLLQNPDLGRQFGEAGRRRVLDDYRWDAVAARIAEVYKAATMDWSLPAGMPPVRDVLRAGFAGAIRALERTNATACADVLAASRALATTFEQGGKVLVCGNGGSAADAQHFAGELVGRFKAPNRRGLPVLSLTADSAVLTAWANDIGYEDVFARQVDAFGNRGDVLIGISTSGTSANVIAAFREARGRGMTCIQLGGRDGGPLKELADIAIVVPSDDTQHIQEAHSVLIHLICDLVERRLAADQPAGFGEQPPTATPARALAATS